MYLQTFLQLGSALCIISSCRFALKLHHQAGLKCAADPKRLPYTQTTGNFLRQSAYIWTRPPPPLLFKFLSPLLYPSALEPNMTVHERIICVWVHMRRFNPQVRKWMNVRAGGGCSLQQASHVSGRWGWSARAGAKQSEKKYRTGLCLCV